MNEQIAKLANQAGFDVDSTGKFGNYSEMHRVEKFAELIVKKCIAVVKSDGEDSPLATDVCRIKADEIRAHFGVEDV